MKSTVVAIIGMMLGMTALGSFAPGDDQKVALKDLPKAVLDAVKGRFPRAELKAAEKETEDNETIYEIALVNDGKSMDVSVDEKGEIEEIETEIAAKDLPKAVTEAVAAKHPKSSIRKAEEIVEIDDGKEEKSYEVVVVDEAKKVFEVKVSPAGKILSDEADDENEGES